MEQQQALQALGDTFSPEQLTLIKRTVAAGTSDDEFKLFIEVCKLTGLNPFARQIYAIMRYTKDGNKMTIQTGIDGYRLIAARTGQLAGIDDATFDCEFDGTPETKYPKKATVTVYRLVHGHIAAFTATARWNEYVQLDRDKQPVQMWAKMPRNQLGKCAEALALRKAFAAEMSGVYTNEEMQQADSEYMPTVSTQRTTQATQQQTATIVDAEIVEYEQHSEPVQEAPQKQSVAYTSQVGGSPATDRQITSIKKLCLALNRPEPDTSKMTFVEARELLTQLSHAYTQARHTEQTESEQKKTGSRPTPRRTNQAQQAQATQAPQTETKAEEKMYPLSGILKFLDQHGYHSVSQQHSILLTLFEYVPESFTEAQCALIKKEIEDAAKALYADQQSA